MRVQREERFRAIEPETPPNYEIQNFWDLAEIMSEQYGVEIPEVL